MLRCMNKLSMLAATLALLTCNSAMAMGPFDVYEQALRNDPVFLGAIKERDAGLENRAIGRAGLLPKLGYNYNKGRNTSKVTYLNERGQNQSDDRNYSSYGSTLTLQQPLLDYEAYAAYRKGVAQSLFADENFRGKSQELLVRVLENYTKALFAQDQIDIALAKKKPTNNSSSRTSKCSARARARAPIFLKPSRATNWRPPRKSRRVTNRMPPCGNWGADRCAGHRHRRPGATGPELPDLHLATGQL